MRSVAGLGLGAALTAVLLAGCAAGPDPVKGQFEGRESLEACGELLLGQGESVPADAWDCLEATASTGAEFVVGTPTTEGDTIRYYFRAGPDLDGVEIFIDRTEDKWGTGKWDRRQCKGDDFDVIVAGCLATFVPVEA